MCDVETTIKPASAQTAVRNKSGFSGKSVAILAALLMSAAGLAVATYTVGISSSRPSSCSVSEPEIKAEIGVELGFLLSEGLKNSSSSALVANTARRSLQDTLYSCGGRRPMPFKYRLVSQAAGQCPTNLWDKLFYSRTLKGCGTEDFGDVCVPYAWSPPNANCFLQAIPNCYQAVKFGSVTYTVGFSVYELACVGRDCNVPGPQPPIDPVLPSCQAELQPPANWALSTCEAQKACDGCCERNKQYGYCKRACGNCAWRGGCHDNEPPKNWALNTCQAQLDGGKCPERTANRRSENNGYGYCAMTCGYC